MQLGVDFGTTRTVVAFVDRGNYPVMDCVDAAGDRANAIPSVAAARDGQIVYGFDAVALAGDPSYSVLSSFKRLLSAPLVRASQPVRLGDTVVPLGELLTGFLAYVRDAVLARAAEGKRRAKDSFVQAAVAVPANALAAQRLVTADASARPGSTSERS